MLEAEPRESGCDDGRVIAAGVDPELDECARSPRTQAPHPGGSRRASASAPASPRSKVRYNRVFGYSSRSPRQPGTGAGGLPAPADAGQRRALRHPRDQGARGADPAPPRSAGWRSSSELFAALRGSVRGAGRGAAPPRRAARRGRRAAALAEAAAPRTATSGPSVRRRQRHPRSPTAATRWWSARWREPFVPNDCELDPERRADRPAHRARTWAASRPTCARSP